MVLGYTVYTIDCKVYTVVYLSQSQRHCQLNLLKIFLIAVKR